VWLHTCICFGNYYRPGQRFVIIVASVVSVAVVSVVAAAPLFINLRFGEGRLKPFVKRLLHNCPHISSAQVATSSAICASK